MELDAYVVGGDSRSVRDGAERLERAGHAGLWSVESNHDPFLPLAIAASGTSTVRLGTNIAVAFARNPMTVAQSAHDLQRLSDGRFVLGLGPQVRAHIERRFSMPWSRPADRMREFVLAVRAIWASWETGEALRFEGGFYRHVLMAPNFDPGPTGFGSPPVYLGAVGPRMTGVAAEVADGVLCHPLTSPEYLSDVLLPAIRHGRAEVGRQGPFTIVVSPLAATGPDDSAITAALERVRLKVAFYASTAAYRPLLDVHGFGELQPVLNALARQGCWSEMADQISDEVLLTFCLVGSPAEIGRAVAQRFGGLADRATIYELDEAGRLLLEGRYLTEPEALGPLVAGFSRGAATATPCPDAS